MTQQLELFSESAPAGPFLCRGIFSAGFLHQHFRRSAAVPSAEEVQPLYAAVRERWLKNRAGLIKQKEAYTRTHFLDALLSELGWEFIPETNLPTKGPLKKRPDYCLCADAASREQGAAQPDTAATFRYAISVLEAKKWGHPLDKVSSQETPGWFPSQQIQDYLRHAKDPTGARLFNWAILTNGGVWRLYCEHAANDSFFEFTLADKDDFCSLADFRLFVALFRPAAFLPENGRCLLDDLRQEALTRQTRLEENLRRRIFDVLEELANAYRDHAPNEITPAQFPALYENALIFLYRLLFVLYAESRTLLPVKPHGAYGSNKLYREKFSLTCLTTDLRNASKFTEDAFTDIYERLLGLFHLINGSEPKKNEAAKVPRYNGGLFHPESWPHIEAWRIGDAAMAAVLKQLIFAQPPARKGAAQLRISTDETIDYASLEVRQLGDIYEGLLGAQLAVNARGRLELRNANGENHRQGIFYTPDWIVRYLLRETVNPLLRAIELTPEVQAALKARSTEKQRDNSFALAVLRLNLVDPAMGSGHFLVRATEWLAEQVVYHPTTRVMTEQIVHSGTSRRTKEEIINDGRIPVPPGVSQEEAEIAYWRRRVVEACIYGVDLNPLAVELTKLSLWLTCIAADEPLNFLDHHLRCGNSLLYAHPDEISSPPAASELEAAQGSFDLGPLLGGALRSVIAENVAIEESASTEMELVKRKEQRWRAVREKIAPFLDTATLWLAAQDGLPLNPLDYLTLARHRLDPDSLENAEHARAEKLRDSLAAGLAAKTAALQPFHWHLEFADVFFAPDGTPRADAQCGFDAILGNPPYISVHTSSEADWRTALERRQGYLDDLYVHFSDLGFALLRPGGGFGFIVSDTFFTLASKLRMRLLLQAHTLTHLGQCDPFDATVDAAIFVARKGPSPEPEPPALFIQARPRRLSSGALSNPEPDLASLPEQPDFPAPDHDGTQHAEHGTLRLHRVPPALWRSAHKQAFFEPRPGTLRLFERFNDRVKTLVEEWWPRIETSEKFSQNRHRIQEYHTTLKPGDVTLVGLIAEGGQGLATANNARFLGYLEGTPQAENIARKRIEWTQRWMGDEDIWPVFKQLLLDNGGDTLKPLKNSAAWEACVEPLRRKFTAVQLGFNKMDLYRIVPKSLVADETDFAFAWKKRKEELWALWNSKAVPHEFWDSLPGTKKKMAKKPLDDGTICEMATAIDGWVNAENSRRRAEGGAMIPRSIFGFRSSEAYRDPADAPRIAVIYQGLRGRGRFVPFRKGDPDGNRWIDEDPLFIEWTPEHVAFLFTNSGKKEHRMPVVRNPHLYFTNGVTWTRVANHVAMKSRLQPKCVFDSDSVRLTPLPGVMPPMAFMALFNSDIVSFLKMRFFQHTAKWEIGNLRQLPIVIPTKSQSLRLSALAELATEAKRAEFAGAAPSHELAERVRALAADLSLNAPPYLRPAAQQLLLATPADCLAVIERAVNLEAERLYGVEGEGPFDEF